MKKINKKNKNTALENGAFLAAALFGATKGYKAIDPGPVSPVLFKMRNGSKKALIALSLAAIGHDVYKRMKNNNLDIGKASYYATGRGFTNNLANMIMAAQTYGLALVGTDIAKLYRKLRI